MSLQVVNIQVKIKLIDIFHLKKKDRFIKETNLAVKEINKSTQPTLTAKRNLQR